MLTSRTPHDPPESREPESPEPGWGARMTCKPPYQATWVRGHSARQCPSTARRRGPPTREGVVWQEGVLGVSVREAALPLPGIAGLQVHLRAPPGSRCNEDQLSPCPSCILPLTLLYPSHNSDIQTRRRTRGNPLPLSNLQRLKLKRRKLHLATHQCFQRQTHP